jgi:hypothetical protein
MAMTMDE